MKGIVYYIKELSTGKIIYVGSTTQALNKRKCAHKYNCYSSDERLNKVPVYRYIRSKASSKASFEEKFVFNTIAYGDFSTREDLYAYEQFFIKMIKPTCNCCKAFASDEDKKQSSKEWRDRNRSKWNSYSKKNHSSEYYKEYREANREQIAASNRKYYEDHRERICARTKESYKTNKSKHSDIMKKYYQEHREEILAKCKARREAKKHNVNNE